MLTSLIRSYLRIGESLVPSTANEKVSCPESPRLPFGMDDSGRCRDRIDEGDNENTDVTFLDFFPTNPALMLTYLKPIFPAADNRVALASVITGNALAGFLLMTRRTPNLKTSISAARFSLILRKITGLLMVASSLIESTRFLLPYDPWAEEAEEWRHWAIRGGDDPGWWFGAIKWYEPMKMPYFADIVSKRLANDRLAIKREQMPMKRDALLQAFAALPGGPLEELVRYAPPSFSDHLYMYKEFKEFNAKHQSELLQGKLKDVNELNKMGRIDSYLEQKITNENEVEYSDFEVDEPQPIHLPDGLTRRDWDSNETLFANAWIRCDPWYEMYLRNQMEVRVIPSSKNLILTDEEEAEDAEQLL